MAIQERVGEKLRVICIDENEKCLELARAKAGAANEATKFRRGTLDQLTLPNNHFDAVVGNGSLVRTGRVPKILSEMVRIAAPDAKVGLALPTASSFGEFFSIYWEALHNIGLIDLESGVEHLITELPTTSDVERMAEEAGLDEVSSWTRLEEFDFESGEQFLNSPLVADFLIYGWLASVPEDQRENVTREIARLINEDRHEAEFALSVKSTLVLGRKAHSH
jgi:ubiquinone/menaquinone biosynthesis C-methylase UbiE